MTPKEKAKELIIKFGLAEDKQGFISTNRYRHKQCALIFVDEIIEVFKRANNNNIPEYWMKVKKEIEKL